ncbi:DUF192 domain-containing protein [Pyrococcus abyssi]|uniref:UPF0127 protein PYRAB11210 n=1 Tax=Pyrococcus abyssi (strain GE5 / Orsay) TaxID=272844 RepID=Y1121_PYRAB|nr:DUF192 domain-containing protein [Pyrococcus abyssi]Q9UZM5.1 RecName: Full=UPF0127 protein PYRAB11210 [Pyrococcus abyssi GE5]CAB50032.1 Hypothetical protein PAB0743 [Pyrococcus abyssi GE5]CCE70534.1 TPA: hypothetical protein PAB0743 [Pyrococcus abyssi GE5]
MGVIINESKSVKWEGKVEIADNFIKRAFGFMLRNPGHALIFILPFETRFNATIHGFFMLKSIDVIFLDSEKTVVDVTTLRPWRIYVPKKAAKYVIEGPVGLRKVLKVEVGDKVEWIT